MRPKTKTLILVLAAAVLVFLLTQAGASGPAAKHVDDGEPTQAAPPSAFSTSNRTRSNPRVRSSALGEQSEAIRIAQDGQAGTGGGSLVTTEPSEAACADDKMVSEDSMPEDRSMYPWEPSQQFWQWRRTWADEAPDTTWAEQLRSELTQRTGDRLRAAATFHQIDCRETICQLYVHADDAQDAQAVIATMSEDRLQVEHEQVAAHVQLEDAPKGGTTYELVVRRDRPPGMPPHEAGAGRAYFLALDAREAIE
jgi:hypothetical protein